jgi:hypothetical protein
MSELSLITATEALKTVLDELNRHEVKEALSEARASAGNDIGLIMEKVVPIFYEVQGHVMQPLGFFIDDEGFAAFAVELQKHEADPDFLALSSSLKAIMNKMTSVKIDKFDEDQNDGNDADAAGVVSTHEPELTKHAAENADASNDGKEVSVEKSS